MAYPGIISISVRSFFFYSPPPGLEGTARPNSRAGRGPGSGQGGDLGAVRKADALPDAEEEAVGLDLVAFAFVQK